MRFLIRLMGNLSDGPRGDVRDKVMDTLVRLARAA